jgi:hypothetical protein
MPGVTVKDVEVCALSHPSPSSESLSLTYPQAGKFITAYAAFLKRQGKLQMYVPPLALNLNSALLKVCSAC